MSPTSAFILGVVAASVVWMPILWLVLNQRDRASWESSHLRVCRHHIHAHHDGDLESWRNYSRRIGGDTHYDGPGAA